MESPWGRLEKRFDSLHRDLNTEVLIIGGGLCGLLCAYELQRAGIDYVLVEADTICGGITKGTTAKITAQHGLIYQKIWKTYGAEKAKQYLQANERAGRRFETLCRTIDCDYEHRDSYVYSPNSREKIAREAEIYFISCNFVIALFPHWVF